MCGGKYLDDLHATYWGTAIPLGFDNNTFIRAIREQPDKGMGMEFKAFVIPKQVATMHKVQK